MRRVSPFLLWVVCLSALCLSGLCRKPLITDEVVNECGALLVHDGE